MRVRAKILAAGAFIITLLMILGSPQIGDRESGLDIDDPNTTSIFTREYNESYTYLNYHQLVEEYHSMEAEFPGLLEVDTAQDLYGLNDTEGGYKIHILTITNENITEDKPEVVFLGGHHGNEQVSVMTAFYFARYLLYSYSTDEDIKFLVDNREIFIVPLINPWGYENNTRENFDGVDPNRDYPFGGNSDPLRSIETRSVFELHKDHQFITGISWHSGKTAIGYPWGCAEYFSGDSETPDDGGFSEVAQQMSLEAGSNILTYPYGRMNEIPQFGKPLEGTWEDWAYGGSWDDNTIIPGFENKGARTLSFIVEISHIKKPSVSQLGTSLGVRSGGEDGYIPKNIRMAILLTDIAEPYVKVTNLDSLPQNPNGGSEVEIKWKVGGCLKVSSTNVHYSYGSDPRVSAQKTTSELSGKTVWGGIEYSQKVAMPNEGGEYQFSIACKVDPALADQFSPDPVLPPQSHYVNLRTLDNWTHKNGGTTIQGRTTYYSDIFKLNIKKTVEPGQNDVEFVSKGGVITGTSTIEIVWKILHSSDRDMEFTQLYWSSDPDPIKNEEYSTTKFLADSARTKNVVESQTTLEYSYTIDLEKDKNSYYFKAKALIQGEEYFTDVINYSFPARLIIDEYTLNPVLEGAFEVEWHIEMGGVVEETYVLISYNENVSSTYFEQFGLSDENKESYFGSYTLPYVSGIYYFEVAARIAGETIRSQVVPFIVAPRLELTGPDVRLEENALKKGFYIIDIENITAFSSNPSIGEVEGNEVQGAFFVIRDPSNQDLLEGQLDHYPETGTWGKQGLSVENLEPGRYWVVVKFDVSNLFNQTEHKTGDSSEFMIPEKIDQDEKTKENKTFLWAILVIVLILIAGFVIFFIYQSKRMDDDTEEPTGKISPPRSRAAVVRKIARKEAAEGKKIARKEEAEEKKTTRKKAGDEKKIARKEAAEGKKSTRKGAAEKKTARKEAAEEKKTTGKGAAEGKKTTGKGAAEKKKTKNRSKKKKKKE